ncbi:MAG: hypothetical protein JWO68_1263, partial [Actinomycetia bacterium]|nr:hypothetical protein [Actinomycetes bacterium]
SGQAARPTRMETVRSADGTALAFEVEGSGPSLVIVTGAFCDRGTTADLATLLAPDLTVLRYDRRGRGDSGDASAYAIEREIEDLAAVLGAAGGDAFVYGHSSGASLVVAAVVAGLPMAKLALYEPPYAEEPGTLELRDEITALLAAGDRAGAVRRFLAGAVGLPEQVVASAEHWPDWPAMVGIAHTLPYDLTLMGDCSVPVGAAGITVPTVVLHGSATSPDLIGGAEALAAAIPGSDLRVLDGQDHGIPAAAIGPVLRSIFL